MGDSEAAVTHVTADTPPAITSVETSSGSTIPTIANPSKAGTSMIVDSTVSIQNPPYPQWLIEIGPASQPESKFLKELQNLYV